MYHYELRDGIYYLVYEGGDERVIGPAIALCFDAREGVLFKHGSPEYVKSYYDTAFHKIKSVVPEWASDMVYFEGPIPLQELDKILSTTGYVKRFYEKALST